MKKSARNRVIVWSIVSVVLTAILVWGIVNINKFGSISLNPINLSELKGVDIEKFTTGEAEFDKDTIKSLDIDWIAGEVNLVLSNSEKIVISEERSSASEDDKMCWYVDDEGKLSVYASKKSRTFLGLFDDEQVKTLTVTVPKNMKFIDFNISTASADINVESVYANKVTAETASGDIEISKVEAKYVDITNVSGRVEAFCQQAGKIDVETVSGEITVDGIYDELNTESISSKTNISAEADNVTIDSESISGEISVALPDNISGFTAEYESVNGKFDCDFAGNNGDEKFVYGDGMAEINMETVSGNMSIDSYSVKK